LPTRGWTRKRRKELRKTVRVKSARIT